MISKVQKDTILTLLSKGAIVFINLAIVVCITQFWGVEGKGYQAIFLVNLGFISIVTDIFTNSSIAYYVRKVGASKLYAQACLWTFICSSCGVLICYFIPNTPFLIFLLISSFLTGYLTFHNALYIGMQKIKYYNIITILQPLFLLIFILLLYKTKQSTYYDYFYAYIFSLIIVILISQFFTKQTVGKIKFQLDFSVTKQSFNYGLKNELSNFFQLIIKRLSYYFILFYLSESSLGIFSVAVAISESILPITRSISVVQYSKIIKEGNTKNARKGVVSSSFFSIALSFFCITVILLLPNSIFTYIFTDACSNLKQIVLLISPGALCISFSNIYGHYFSAIGKMNILVFRSVVGAILTLILLIIFIPMWGINGACIISSFVHFICAAIMVGYFIKIKNEDKLILE